MDNLINFASQQLQNQGGNQQQQGQQGQQQQQQQQQQGGGGADFMGMASQFMNSQGGNGQQQQGQNQQSGGGGGAAALMGMASSFMGSQGGQSGSGGFDFAALLAGANQQHGNGEKIQGQMQEALGAVQNAQNPNASVDEQKAQQAHDQAYNQGNGQQMSAEKMGAAAAIQAFKDFASGGQQQQQQGSQSLISKLLGMAFSEAVKLFTKSGGAANGTQQDVVNSAGATMMQLLIQNQIKGALGGGTGGNSSGGPDISQLMGLASKFLAK